MITFPVHYLSQQKYATQLDCNGYTRIAHQYDHLVQAALQKLGQLLRLQLIIVQRVRTFLEQRPQVTLVSTGHIGRLGQRFHRELPVLEVEFIA